VTPAGGSGRWPPNSRNSCRIAGDDNRSGVHWDMICDLRAGGKLHADGQTVLKDGRFVGFDFG
jgi:hypothetical protein